jgi:hypothetical protein
MDKELKDKQLEIAAEIPEFKPKTFEQIKADMLNPSETADTPADDGDEDDIYTKAEVDDMMSRCMSSMYGTMMSYMNELYSCMTSSDRGLAKQINAYIQSHGGSHLPPLHPGQIKAMLEKCGIAEDFAEQKPPMIQSDMTHIYASTDSIKSKLQDVKFEVK